MFLWNKECEPHFTDEEQTIQETVLKSHVQIQIHLSSAQELTLPLP